MDPAKGPQKPAASWCKVLVWYKLVLLLPFLQEPLMGSLYMAGKDVIFCLQADLSSEIHHQLCIGGFGEFCKKKLFTWPSLAWIFPPVGCSRAVMWHWWPRVAQQPGQWHETHQLWSWGLPDSTNLCLKVSAAEFIGVCPNSTRV